MSGTRGGGGGSVGGLLAANNLSDLVSAATARTNLGLGTAAVLAAGAILLVANNLSDLASAATARTNLGLGTAAVVNTGASGATLGLLNAAWTHSGKYTNALGTITVSTPLTITQTWNGSGVTFAGLLVDVTDTASASGSKLLDLQVSSSSVFRIEKQGYAVAAGGFYSIGAEVDIGYVIAGIGIRNDRPIQWSSTTQGGGSPDVVIRRDAAGVLAQRNSTNAQTFNIYNTWTDASNKEYALLGWDSNIFYIQTLKAGSGSNRNLAILPSGSILSLGTGGATQWNISSGHLLAQADNTYDIGASGATRPRNLYLSGGITSDGISSLGDGVLIVSPSSPAIGIQLWQSWCLNWNGDLRLFRDDANILAQRNSASAQEFRVYNTWTDASNYERAKLKWNSNILQIGSDAAGTGADRDTKVGIFSGSTLTQGIYCKASTGVFLISSSGAYAGVNPSGGGFVVYGAVQMGFNDGSTGVDGAPNLDTGLARSAAAIISLTNGSTGGGVLETKEVTAPSAPASDKVRIYAEDNGSGKTRLMAIFSSGAAQQIAIQP